MGDKIDRINELKSQLAEAQARIEELDKDLFDTQNECMEKTYDKQQLEAGIERAADRIKADMADPILTDNFQYIKASKRAISIIRAETKE